MRYFLTHKEYYRKVADVFLILAFLGTGLYIYNSFKYEISFFQRYHLNAYWDLVKTISSNNSNEFTIVQSEKAKAVPVLVYHGVLSDEDYESGDESVKHTSISYSRFRDHLFSLKKSGWNTVSYSDYEKFRTGKLELPEKSFLLTFDDARKDSFYPVDPLLKALDFNAVIFVIAEQSLGEDNRKSTHYLSVDELKQASNSGRWGIQSHGGEDHDFIAIDQAGNKGTYLSNKKWLSDEQRNETDQEFSDRVFNDLKKSKEALEETFGKTITGYAFPFGDFGLNTINYPESSSVINDITKQIYKETFYQVSYSDSDIFNYPGNEGMTKRIKGDSALSGEEIVSLLNKSAPKSLPFEDYAANSFEWKKNWGDLTFESGLLNMKSTKDATSAFASLAGTSSWENYSFTATIDHHFGQATSLIGYYQSENSFYACTFTDKYVRLQRTREGKTETLEEFKLAEDLQQNIKASFGQDETGLFACGLNNSLYVSSERLSPDERSGQIGYRIWDADFGRANLMVVSTTAYEGYLEKSLVRIDKESEEKKDLDTEVIDKEIPLLEMSDPISLTYYWSPQSSTQWQKTWGNVSRVSEGIEVMANSNTTGSMMVLPGSQLWEDVKITYNLEWRGGTNVVVVFRFQDNDNFAALNISDNSIQIEEIVKGKTKVIEYRLRDFSDKNSDGFYKKKLNVVVRSGTDIVSVFLNGNKMLETNEIKRLPRAGLVGLKVWDKDKNEASVILNSLLAEEIK